MAVRVTRSQVVELWMASQSICKQASLERWSGLKAWSHVAVIAEEAGCWRLQMPTVALKQLRIWSDCSTSRGSARSVSLSGQSVPREFRFGFRFRLGLFSQIPEGRCFPSCTLIGVA